MTRLLPGLRRGTMSVPVSKSHAHRVLIAEFLAGRTACLAPDAADCDDIAATKRCLRELAFFSPVLKRRDSASTLAAASSKVEAVSHRFREGEASDKVEAVSHRFREGEASDKVEAVSHRFEQEADVPLSLDCGESGTTRRLLGPVVAALGVKPNWIMKGRLASRPQIDYATLAPGVQTLAGDVSSQFVSGLLFALPLLKGDSEIRLTSPLASRGYVAMTLGVLEAYGVSVEETATGFRVPGNQRFVAPGERPSFETDWSGAAFPLALQELGNAVEIAPESLAGLRADSLQPDRVVGEVMKKLARGGDVAVDVDECPDLFPVLAVVAAHRADATRFTGIRRLRLKESDRVAAMKDALNRFGITVLVSDDAFEVYGRITPLQGGAFTSCADHRIAMALAVGATVADAPVEIDDVACAAKSYPGFFAQFASLAF